MRYDVMYVEGPGDIVSAFDSWLAGVEHASETAVTYSSQLFSHCRAQHQSLLAITYGAGRTSREADGIRVESRPRRMLRLPKIGYRLSLLWYAFRIRAWTMLYRPRLVLLTSGVVSWNVARVVLRTGADVVPILHNSLWPEGHRPDRPRDTAWWASDTPPFTLAVSAAIARQVASLGAAAQEKTIEFRPTFADAEFPPAQQRRHDSGPFRIVFAGRLEIDKGVLDLIEIASALERAAPGRFHIDICGSGSQASTLASAVMQRQLEGVVTLWGRLDRMALLRRYDEAHVCVVPTRSSFSEGFAQVVAESILLMRPVVTSRVVPSSELYGGAVILATTDDPASYVDALLRLARDARAYADASASCAIWRLPILDRKVSFLGALEELDRRRHSPRPRPA